MRLPPVVRREYVSTTSEVDAAGETVASTIAAPFVRGGGMEVLRAGLVNLPKTQQGARGGIECGAPSVVIQIPKRFLPIPDGGRTDQIETSIALSLKGL